MLSNDKKCPSISPENTVLEFIAALDRRFPSKRKARAELDLAWGPVRSLKRFDSSRGIRVDAPLDTECVEGVHIDAELKALGP